jgi:hypothetical protein
MSCLYSSPELLPWINPTLIAESELPRLDAARLSSAPNHDAVQNRTDVANHRVQQMTRSPTAGAHRQRTKSFTLPKQAGSIAQGFCCVSLQAQFRLSFTLRSRAARDCARMDLRFGTFQSAGFSLPGPTRFVLRGQQPWTDLLAGT